MTYALVVGTGSAGRRHIGNLLEAGARVCAYRYRGAAVGEPLPEAVEVIDDLQAAMQTPCDAVVVANRTDLHMPVALQAARLGKALFIEKPLAVSMDGVEELRRMAEASRLTVEVGFMLRFHPNLQWMKDYVEAGELGALHHVRAAVGQHLPAWRPGTDHRNGYAARREWGGGVIFDLIHELDLVCWLAGPAEEANALLRHTPSLEIETEAIAQIGLRLATGVLAQVHLDYVRPVYGRTLELVGEKGVLTWDYVAGTVTLEAPGEPRQVVHRVPSGFERNDMFRAHMAHFLRRLQHPAPPAASLAEGIASLQTALACHRAAAERRTVRLNEFSSLSIEERST